LSNPPPPPPAAYTPTPYPQNAPPACAPNTPQPHNCLRPQGHAPPPRRSPSLLFRNLPFATVRAQSHPGEQMNSLNLAGRQSLGFTMLVPPFECSNLMYKVNVRCYRGW